MIWACRSDGRSTIASFSLLPSRTYCSPTFAPVSSSVVTSVFPHASPFSRVRLRSVPLPHAGAFLAALPIRPSPSKISRYASALSWPSFSSGSLCARGAVVRLERWISTAIMRLVCRTGGGGSSRRHNRVPSCLFVFCAVRRGILSVAVVSTTTWFLALPSKALVTRRSLGDMVVVVASHIQPLISPFTHPVQNLPFLMQRSNRGTIWLRLKTVNAIYTTWPLQCPQKKSTFFL